ncbi:CDP-diacylglycerol-serine O-phosphatidyltransferase [Geofilum rubicundum JCM 15548]|uniref:CDP-diacylglycerol-serine O-phosphatidyltransferase n=2 Tax=Geofilum TaxID=1236988 RepID=A0A0E9LUX7_9BACT|nr:CDP-diacylglycerol-serine O-phosphatidyltransferase [Geofilum rubicundum JCM 15548]
MSIVRHIPNALTSGNLFLGTTGAYLALVGRPDLTAWCVLAAALLDFLDGFAARMLHAYSDIGKDLDSLADLVSFGVAPAAVLSAMVHFSLTGQWSGLFLTLEMTQQALVLMPFLLVVFSALRLAKFNNDERQSESFIGLTTTATGMFTVSLAYLIFKEGGWWLQLTNPWAVLAMVAVFSALLVSEIPMFSLKFKSFGWKGNENRYVLLVVSLFALVFLQVGALAVIVPAYVLYSIVLAVSIRSKISNKKAG